MNIISLLPTFLLCPFLHLHDVEKSDAMWVALDAVRYFIWSSFFNLKNPENGYQYLQFANGKIGTQRFGDLPKAT